VFAATKLLFRHNLIRCKPDHKLMTVARNSKKSTTETRHYNDFMKDLDRFIGMLFESASRKLTATFFK